MDSSKTSAGSGKSLVEIKVFENAEFGKREDSAY